MGGYVLQGTFCKTCLMGGVLREDMSIGNIPYRTRITAGNVLLVSMYYWRACPTGGHVILEDMFYRSYLKGGQILWEDIGFFPMHTTLLLVFDVFCHPKSTCFQ